ncbi:MAG: cation diffusion facilitator family transporter [Lachnospiraceae bacterium]
MKQEKTEKQVAMHVSSVSIGVNLGLSLLKLLAGIIGKSGAMISDAVHSASDVFSTFIVIIGVNIAGKSSDSDHQYGHERMECVASIVLAVILAATGLGIGVNGVRVITSGDYSHLVMPGMMALVAAVVSIVVKEWMFWYTRAAAKKINSGALMADAWHHRSDALSSIGAFIGILGSRMGVRLLDPIASVVICLFIEKAAYDIFKDAVDKMVDKACPKDVVEKMRDVVAKQTGVERIDDIKTRMFGSKVYVDVEISADGKKTLNETHHIAEEVHDAIEQGFPDVKHCMVHVNPVEGEPSSQKKAVG